MTTYLISRHPGGIEWLRARAPDGIFVRHLDLGLLERGDRICGTLPIHLAARACEMGVRVEVLSVCLPPGLRGQELSARQLDELGARLVPYHVQQL